MFIERKRGFTLLEVLVYVGLFSIIIGGALFGSFQIIESSVRTRILVHTQQEAHFIFRKIDLALNGEVISVSEPSEDTLFVDRGGVTNYTFEAVGETLMLNGASTTSSSIKVTGFSVVIVPAAPPVPEAVEISFELNGRQVATTTRYIR